VTIYKSDGVTVVKQWAGLSGPYAVAIGAYDLAFSESGAGRVTVYESDGTTVIKQWTGLSSPGGIAIGDYDNLGANNLAFTEYVNGNVDKLTVWNSDGSNTISKQLTGLQNSWGVCIGDLNNDGLNDLAFSEAGAGKVTIYYQHARYGSINLNSSRSNVYRLGTLRGTLTNASGYPIQSGSIRVTMREGSPNGPQVWQDIFNNTIDNGRYNIQLGVQKAIDPRKIKDSELYFYVIEIDANSPTFVSAKVTFGDNNPPGDVCLATTVKSSKSNASY
jgi:hypothetical protein